MDLTVLPLPSAVSVPRYRNGTLVYTPSVVHVETNALNTTIYTHGHVAELAHDSFPLLSAFVTSYLSEVGRPCKATLVPPEHQWRERTAIVGERDGSSRWWIF